jgi:hypothetical protein
MKYKCITAPLLLMALFLAVAPTAVASTRRYVNGVTGSDSNNCLSPTTACKTIGHAISLASSSDSIMVAAATYTENLTIGFSLTVVGSGAGTTIIDGGRVNTVVTVSNPNAYVSLSKLKIRNGHTNYSCGGGVYNIGTLAISNGTISRNFGPYGGGGGICNGGTLTINNSTISGNQAGGSVEHFTSGGGISNGGTLTINNSTISGNSVHFGTSGGIYNVGTATINNSTISGNTAKYGTGGIELIYGTVTIQNSIVANNSGGNCSGGTLTSKGYNLSGDNTCNFNNTGDLNNTDPKLGPLNSNGGPTPTQALLSGSPAIDAGRPSGCTDGQGYLLTTDQRGKPRPNIEDTGGCDMGAYERQSD